MVELRLCWCNGSKRVLGGRLWRRCSWLFSVGGWGLRAEGQTDGDRIREDTCTLGHTGGGGRDGLVGSIGLERVRRFVVGMSFPPSELEE